MDKTKDIKYGKVTESTNLDDLGSQKIVTRNYRAGVPLISTRYEIRKLVTTSSEELAEYVRFRKEYAEKKKSEFRIEPYHSGKGYFVVKCWEE